MAFVAKTGQQPVNSPQSSVQGLRLSPGPTPFAPKTCRQPVLTPQQPSIQLSQAAAEQTKPSNAELRAKLATAEQQIAQLKLQNEKAEHRYRSQHGQLLSAERDAGEFRKVNPSIAHYNRAKNEATQRLRIANHQLKEANDKLGLANHQLREANEKIAELERMLGAEKYKTVRLEESLAAVKSRGRGGEKKAEAGDDGASRR